MKRLLLALAALLVGSVPAEAQTTQDVDITVTHGTACTGGPTVAVAEPAAPAGSTIHVNFACGPGNQKDWISLVTASNHQGNSPLQYVNGATSGTLIFTAPNAASDRDLQYIASFQSNDSFTVIAQSPPFTVPATVNRPTRREQTLDPHAVEVITALTFARFASHFVVPLTFPPLYFKKLDLAALSAA
jgi:hypothetical protein